eukprot:1602441-Rhodomonas_salina.6
MPGRGIGGSLRLSDAMSGTAVGFVVPCIRYAISSTETGNAATRYQDEVASARWSYALPTRCLVAEGVKELCYENSGTVLRACYAMSGTDIAEVVPCCAMSGTDVRCAAFGTALCTATRCP